MYESMVADEPDSGRQEVRLCRSRLRAKGSRRRLGLKAHGIKIAIRIEAAATSALACAAAAQQADHPHRAAVEIRSA